MGVGGAGTRYRDPACEKQLHACNERSARGAVSDRLVTEKVNLAAVSSAYAHILTFRSHLLRIKAADERKSSADDRESSADDPESE